MQLRHLVGALLLGLICTLTLALPGAAQDLVPGQIVLRLNPGENIEDVNATFGTTVLDVFEDDDGFDVLYLLDASGLGDEIILAGQMAADPRVFEAEPNFLQDTPEGVRHMVVIAIGGTQSEYEDQTLTDRIDVAPRPHDHAGAWFHRGRPRHRNRHRSSGLRRSHRSRRV